MASVQGTVPDQSWGQSLPGGFHQDVQPTLYDVNFLLPRPNPIVPAVVSQNTVGACYDRGYIDLRPTRKETTRQYITDPSSYVQDLHPFGLGGGTGGVDNLSMLSRFGHPLPYADNEATEEINFLAKRESAIERVDPLSNGYAAQILGKQGEVLLKRHEISKQNVAKRDAALAARAELTLKEGMALHGKKADIGAANKIASESAAAIDRTAAVEIQRRARVNAAAAIAERGAALEAMDRSVRVEVEGEDEEETKDPYDRSVLSQDERAARIDRLVQERARMMEAYNLQRGVSQNLREEIASRGEGDDANPDSGGSTAGQGGDSFTQNFADQTDQAFMIERAARSQLYDDKDTSMASTVDRRNSNASTIVRTPLDMSASASSNSNYFPTPYMGGSSSAASYSGAYGNQTRAGAQSIISTSQNADHLSGVNQAYDARLVGFRRANIAGGIDYDTGANSNATDQLIDNSNANFLTGVSNLTPNDLGNVGAQGFQQLSSAGPSFTTQGTVNYSTPTVGNRTLATPGQTFSNSQARSAGMYDTPHMTASPFQRAVARLNSVQTGLRPNQNGSAERLAASSILGSNVPIPRTLPRGRNLEQSGAYGGIVTPAEFREMTMGIPTRNERAQNDLFNLLNTRR